MNSNEANAGPADRPRRPRAGEEEEGGWVAVHFSLRPH